MHVSTNMKISHASSIDDSQEILKFNNQVVKWYEKNARRLPWRAPVGADANAYHVWLSEIMLQQTTVTAVIPYFEKFISLWPNVQALASADNQDVMDAWAGLGYYSRARNLHKCAQVICNDYQGLFPNDEKALLMLPGIGPYTAAAIASIAFHQRAAVMDGNIERIFARYHNIQGYLPDIKPKLKHYIAEYLLDNSAEDPSSLAQGLMDIGATICQPKKISCSVCPLQEGCTAYANDSVNPLDLPRKRPKVRPTKYGFCFIVDDGQGRILIERRPGKGLFANMQGFPIHIRDNFEELVLASPEVDVDKNYFVEHIFTHFHLKLYVIKIGAGAFVDLPLFDTIKKEWLNIAELGDLSLPSLFNKVRKII